MILISLEENVMHNDMGPFDCESFMQNIGTKQGSTQKTGHPWPKRYCQT